MGADPEPDNGVAGHDAEGAVSCVDPGGPEGFDFLKAKGAVVWVFGPKAVLLAGLLPDLWRKLLVSGPEAGGAVTFHRPGRGGSCRSGDRRGLPRPSGRSDLL